MGHFYRLIYTLIFYLAMPAIVLRLWWRGRKAPAYRRRWRERFGYVEPVATDADDNQPVVWVHAVSVGETIAAAPLVKALQAQYPAACFVVTTTTPTGSERVTAIYQAACTDSSTACDRPRSSLWKRNCGPTPSPTVPGAIFR